MKKTILCTVVTLNLLHGMMPETEIGINIGMNSTKNEHGSKFENPMLGVTYQDNSYVIMPRVDIEYVSLNTEKADALIKASLNGVYEYENSSNISPYVLLGVGYEKVQGEVKDVFESHAFVQGGAGLRINLDKGYKARIEGRFLQILGGENEENEAILTAGLSIPLDYKKESVKTVPPIDSKPIRPKVVHIVKPIVIKQAPKVIYSNNNECSIKIALPDLDRDGVENRLDQCPATPCNFSVDNYGCPIKATLKVHFASNSANIRDYSMVKITDFADFLLKNKGSMVKIVGHTDSVGSKSFNRTLSYRRARAVVEVLMNKGISISRLRSEGKGESLPIASNKTKEGRARNRRIEAILSYPRGRK